MAPVTEVAQLFLKAGQDPTKPGKAQTIWQEAVDAVLAHEGSLRLYWGTEVENPQTFRLFIDWEKLEHHTDWMKADDYPPKQLLRPLLSGPAVVQHSPMTPHPPSAALTAPTTEILTVYFPETLSSEAQGAAESSFNELLKGIERHAAGYKGSAGGWVLEEVVLPKEPGKKGKAYVALIGWESVEAHMAFREANEFKEVIDHLTGIKDMVDRSAVHVHCVSSAK